uniref:RNAse_Pc domain-containing protein n=1 Tax=Haemonchus placei TaxID=6290 RepID=A0A0N4X0R5_HAEPC
LPQSCRSSKVGGLNSRSVEKLNPEGTSRVWQCVAPLKQKRCVKGVAVVEQFIYAVCCRNSPNALNRIRRYCVFLKKQMKVVFCNATSEPVCTHFEFGRCFNQNDVNQWLSPNGKLRNKPHSVQNEILQKPEIPLNLARRAL